MAFTLLVTAPALAGPGLNRLEAAGCRLHFLEAGQDTGGIEELLGTLPFDGVISRTVHLSGAAIRACPTLRVISKHGAGIDDIDVEAATLRGIPVFFAPGANAASVAELAIGLMLCIARGIPAHDREMHGGRWNRSRPGIQLRGRTLGLVGFGRVAKHVAGIAAALGMQVIAFDPEKERERASPIRFVASLPELLHQSEVLSLHCPLNFATRHLIGAAELAQLPRGAIVINTARGKILDEEALVANLGDGHVFGAGLDTHEEEPPPARRALLSLPNVVLTPHVGGSTQAALDAVADRAAANILDFLQGGSIDPAACANPCVLASRVPAR